MAFPGTFFILALVVLVAVVITALLSESFIKEVVQPKLPQRNPYQYRRKQFFMSRPENDFYHALIAAVGDEYEVFAQVHLPTLLDHKISGQNWKGALGHIDRKSVDFVLCDKVYLSPKLAIELDDKSHERPERIDRDRIVEQILEQAGMPLLRVQNYESLDAASLKEKVRESVG